MASSCTRTPTYTPAQEALVVSSQGTIQPAPVVTPRDAVADRASTALAMIPLPAVGRQSGFAPPRSQVEQQRRQVAALGPTVYVRERPGLNFPKPYTERTIRESSAWRSQQSDNNERYGRYHPRDSTGVGLLNSTLQSHYEYVRNWQQPAASSTTVSRTRSQQPAVRNRTVRY